MLRSKKITNATAISLLVLNFLFGSTLLNAQESMSTFVQNSDTVVVYKEVPGLAPSDKYTIRVRSAATNNEWVNVFAHYTYNRAFELEDINRADGTVPPSTTTQHYANHTSGWSHSYGNIEMSKNTPVEVEIAAKNGFKIGGQDFVKATVHPAQKTSVATMVDGKVYFTISNPGQLVIDINGQMDDFNVSINPIGHPVHAISLFANPVIKKPTLNNPRVRLVEPGSDYAALRLISTASFDTLYFKAGVHEIGKDFKLHPGKTYYIAGDAMLYGNLNNLDVPQGSYATTGENIHIYGYGTLSQAKISHPDYVVNPTGSYKSIELVNGRNWSIRGVCIADPSNHSTLGISSADGLYSWMKIISWRANGDGLAGYCLAEDCFIRTQDDCSYAKGPKRRCTFWKDANAALFHLASIPENRIEPIIIEDCDVIYARLRTKGALNGGGFQQRGEGNLGVRNVNVIFRNFRVHDKTVGMSFFHLVSYQGSNADAPTAVGASYKGFLFQNISIAGMAEGSKQRILGCAEAPWYGGLIFDNITIGGVKMTAENYTNYFETNKYVKDIWFRMPLNFTISTNSNVAQGSITISPVQTTYIENSITTLTAVPIAGFEFTGWSGDTIATSNPLLLKMNSNKNITANFIPVGTKTLTISPSSNGSIAVYPAGASQTTNSTVSLTAKPAIGYKLDSWSGDVVGNNSVSTLKMDADKTVSATFVKTNNFAINCGGDQYIAADGTVYVQTPAGYTKTNTITGTTDQFIYQSERSANAPFSYDLPVDNGDYTLVLKFAEVWATASGKRVFNVAVEGTPVLSNFDIFVEAGGANKAIDKTFKATVADGTLNIAFTSVVNNSKISAIKVTNDQETSVKKVTQNVGIRVYPNPATDVLNIEHVHDATIRIYDMRGALLYNEKTSGSKTSIDVAKFKNSKILLLNVLSDNNSEFVKIIVE